MSEETFSKDFVFFFSESIIADVEEMCKHFRPYRVIMNAKDSIFSHFASSFDGFVLFFFSIGRKTTTVLN